MSVAVSIRRVCAAFALPAIIALAPPAPGTLNPAQVSAGAQTPPARNPQESRGPDTFSLDDLRRAEKARDEALRRLAALQRRDARSAREAAEVDADLIAAATDGRRREEAVIAAEARLVKLDADVAQARARLNQDLAGREDLLAALMTLSGRPPPALASSPEDAAAAVRAAILMGEAAPALSQRAKELREQIDALNAATLAATKERDRLTAEETTLAARRSEIEALAEEKRIVRTSLASETAMLEAETRRLASEADTLRDLLDGLASSAPLAPARKPAPPTAKGAKPQKQATTPRTSQSPASGAGQTKPGAAGVNPSAPGAAPLSLVVGRKVKGFGQPAAGETHKGLTLATRGGAQVIAPMDARIEFAGEFRSYGQMLILDVGGDMLVVVSGLGALYPETGQWVLAGEPIGRMSDQKSPDPELYLEVRRQGQPVDPERWLGRGA